MKLEVRATALLALLAALVGSIVLPAAAAAQHRVPREHQELPRFELTPGDVLTTRARDVCTPGWASAHRDVSTSAKRHVYALYGRRPVAGKCCEVDHAVSLQLGGSNALANLWPQPYPQAYAKDSVENWTHRKVCSGELSLPDAQRMIARDWTQLYRAMRAELGK
jgi:hypothetical protein